jgi:hypothetical protein
MQRSMPSFMSKVESLTPHPSFVFSSIVAPNNLKKILKKNLKTAHDVEDRGELETTLLPFLLSRTHMNMFKSN